MSLCQGLVDADCNALGNYTAIATRYRGNQCVVSRTGYTGEDGIEVMLGTAQAAALWDEFIARGALPCGLGARDSLRLEASMPLYGHELSEDVDPFSAGLGRSVSLDKGEFIGRSALQTAKAEATSRPRRVGIEMEGRRAAREGASIVVGGNAVGKVTSGCFAPTLQKSIAMGMIAPAHAGTGTSIEVDMRGSMLPGKVVALPFYRRNKN
jgi:aminomethyltransferase